MRKLVYSALAFSAAMAVGFGVQAADASAETTVTAEKDTLTVTVPGAKNLFVGEAKVQKKEYLNVTNWDVYQSEAAVIDISKLSKTKDHFIQVKADYSDEIVATIKIEASDKITAKYNKTNAKIEVKSGKEDYAGTLLNFRTESGGSGVITVADGIGTVMDKEGDDGIPILDRYQVSGATLYVQTPGIEVTPVASGGLKAGDYILKDENGDLAGWKFKPASKETKLSIGKLANAPKVKANYVKGEITIPKNVAYQYVNAGEDEGSTVPTDGITKIDAKNATTLKIGTETDLDTNKTVNATLDFGIKVQTPAVAETSTTKPKLASKVGFYTFTPQTETLVTSETISGLLTTSGKSTLLTLTNKTTVAAPTDYVVTYTKEGVTSTTTAQLKAAKTTKLAKIDVSKPVTIQKAGNAKGLTWPGTAKIYYLLEIPDSPVEGADMDNTLASMDIVTDNRTASSSDDQTQVTKYTVTINGSGYKVFNGTTEVSSGSQVSEGTVLTVKSSGSSPVNVKANGSSIGSCNSSTGQPYTVEGDVTFSK